VCPARLNLDGEVHLAIVRIPQASDRDRGKSDEFRSMDSVSSSRGAHERRDAQRGTGPADPGGPRSQQSTGRTTADGGGHPRRVGHLHKPRGWCTTPQVSVNRIKSDREGVIGQSRGRG
jgi:hypothetical protein